MKLHRFLSRHSTDVQSLPTGLRSSVEVRGNERSQHTEVDLPVMSGLIRSLQKVLAKPASAASEQRFSG